MNSFTRQFFCEQCGGDKPWVTSWGWVMDEGKSFCSPYCAQNYQSYLHRLFLKGKAGVKPKPR